MKQKKILASALLLLLTGGVNAQELSSYHFIEAQGGLQFTSTNAKITKLLNPTYSLSYGYMTPTVGGRLNINGLESKSRFESLDQDYKWKYYTADLDLLLNLTNIFSKDYSHALNVMFVDGVGLTHTWNHEGQDQASVKRDLFHNLRAGLRLETNVTKPLGVSLEIDANNTSDFYNGKVNNSDDWGFSAMLGVSYRFGQKYQTKKAELKSPETNAIAMADVEIGNYQMMTTKLNSEMEIWEKRMPNESLEDYEIRVNPTTRAAQTQKLKYEIATQMATTQLPASEVRLGRYNTKLKKLAVQVGSSVPDIYLDMDEGELGNLYNNKNLKLKNAKYTVKEDNSYELVYAEVENTMTGKTYVFDNLNNESMKSIQQDINFVPVATIVEAQMKQKSLEAIKKDLAKLTKEEELLSDKTHIYVSSKPEVAKNEKGQEIINYNVAVSYEVEENFSTRDDFKPGQYHAEDSKAAMLMLGTMKKAFENDFAKYLADGKRVKIIIKGMADASPISRTIDYDGSYGEFRNQPVVKNGANSTVTLTKEGGISDNDQLAFARAAGVQNYIQKEIPSLRKMKQNTDYVIEVSNLTGGKYRRISVQCIFVNAF